MNLRDTTLAELSKTQKLLVRVAQKASENAYCPYSHFEVGAALITRKGDVFSAANMENASYGLSICAEAGAIQKAFNENQREIVSIAVVGGNKDQKDNLITPCGRCRQLIFESSSLYANDIEVILCSYDLTKISVTTISELLPLPFGPMNLKTNI